MSGHCVRWMGAWALSALVLAGHAMAQVVPATTSVSAGLLEMRPGERLSDWLLRWQDAGHPADGPSAGALPAPGQGAFLVGLMLSRPALRPLDLARRDELLQHLEKGSSPTWAPLAAWLRDQPVHGRWPLLQGDARWLQANPAQDPVLQAGDRVWVPARPEQVSVLLPDGRVCQTMHRPGAAATRYLNVCLDAAGLPAADEAWIAQPDGLTLYVGVAAWNAQAQALPAPGAWIWAELPGWRLGTEHAQKLALVLASLGPAPDREPPSQGLLRAGPHARAAWLAEQPRDLPLTASDWGEIGLLQTPTARMSPAGTMRFHWSRVQPYSRGTVMLQPFDWLEGGFRYTDVANRLYGPAIAGDQSLKDKGIDFKLRLWQEGPWAPQLSLGARDIGGTGRFSGEYLVASKRWGGLDFSLGLGWGYLGARGDLPNPLGTGFAIRPGSNTPTGGTVNTSALFRGRTALFGGVQWQTPWQNLIVKAEIEGNDYRNEPWSNPQKQSTPLNVGVVWRARPGMDLTAGIERGQRAMVGITFYSALASVSAPKTLDPPLPRPAPLAVGAAPDWAAMAGAVQTQRSWRVEEVREDGDQLVLRLSDTVGAYKSEGLERVTAIVNAFAPRRFTRFVLDLGQGNLRSLEVRVVNRARWEKAQQQPSPPGVEAEAISQAAPQAAALSGQPAWRLAESPLKLGVAPTFGYILGGPDGFLLYQLGLAGNVRLQLDKTSWISGVLHARVVDNFDKFKYTAPSNLPRVRTYQREYVTSRRLTVPYLQWTHTGRLSENQFYMAYAGLLEPMFGGAGAEWMWRPAGSLLSLSVDMNRVRQRAFEQDFAFRDYEVTTGHATVRWNTPWQGVSVSASAGQYLAGDRGATLDISRTFSNGVTMGAWATKTNVSREAFGEGSFDKGIYLNLPLDAFLARSTNAYANVIWKPLTRDGGAKLSRNPTLYGVTQVRDSEAFRLRPADVAPMNALEDR